MHVAGTVLLLIMLLCTGARADRRAASRSGSAAPRRVVATPTVPMRASGTTLPQHQRPHIRADRPDLTPERVLKDYRDPRDAHDTNAAPSLFGPEIGDLMRLRKIGAMKLSPSFTNGSIGLSLSGSF